MNESTWTAWVYRIDRSHQLKMVHLLWSSTMHYNNTLIRIIWCCYLLLSYAIFVRKTSFLLLLLLLLSLPYLKKVRPFMLMLEVLKFLNSSVVKIVVVLFSSNFRCVSFCWCMCSSSGGLCLTKIDVYALINYLKRRETTQLEKLYRSHSRLLCYIFLISSFFLCIFSSVLLSIPKGFLQSALCTDFLNSSQIWAEPRLFLFISNILVFHMCLRKH